MTHIIKYAIFWFSFIVLLSSFFQKRLKAHDSGHLSHAKFSIKENSLSGTASFAWEDFDKIVSLDQDKNDELSLEEFQAAQQKLEALSKILYDIKVGSTSLSPSVNRVDFDPLIDHELKFSFTYPLPSERLLSFQFNLFDPLPFGHHHYFSILNKSGEVFSESLLSADNPLVENIEGIATAP